MRHDFHPTPEDTFRTFLDKCRAHVQAYRTLSMAHTGWYTHKNPYGCWICDLLLDAESMFNYIEDIVMKEFILAKSPRLDDMSLKSQGENQDEV